MIQRTICETPSETFDRNSLELSDAYRFIARPNRLAQNRMPI